MSRRFSLPVFGLIVAVAWAGVLSFARAADRPFDFDEIATVAVVGDGSAAAIWRALGGAADANPPTFYLLESLGLRLSSDPHVAFRLAPIAGFLGIPIALFLIVSGRYGHLAGLTAALLPFVTPLFTFYPLEARPYTVATCLVAWAWLMWQQAERRGRAIALAVLLAGAVAMHYYAILVLVVFGLAELTRTVRLSQVRMRIWVALLAACAPLALFWPLLSQFNQQYGGSFWTQPQLLTAYTELLGVTERWAAPLVAWLLIAIAVTMFGPSSPWWKWRRSTETGDAPRSQGATTENTGLYLREEQRRELGCSAGRMPAPLPPRAASSSAKPVDADPAPLEDWVIAVAFLTLPVMTYVAAVTLGIAMVSRYTESAILGFAVAVVMLACRSRAKSAVSWLLLAVLLVVTVEQADISRFGRVSARMLSDHGDVGRLNALVRRSGFTELPTVVSNGLRYLPMAYYAASSESEPFFYLIDNDAAIKVNRTDSPERAITTLAPYLPLRLDSRSQFLAVHSRFLLYSENEFWDWLPVRLMGDGYSMRLVARDSDGGTNHMLFLVEAPASAPH